MRIQLVVVLSLLLLTAGAAAPVTATTGSNSTVHSVNGACSFPFTTTDGTGTQVTVAQNPQRVVTLNPSAAQIMWEIGGKSKVVGVSKYAAYLNGASSRTNVSGSGSAYVDEEKVINLRPDLVLAPNTIPNSTVQKLRQAGLTVYRYPPATSITDIENQTRLTGKLTGECSGAQQTATHMQSQLANIQTAISGLNQPKVLYTFYGYTAGKGTFINQIIKAAGGDNVAADAGISGYKQISKETIINQNPHWIIRNSQHPSVPHTQVYDSTYAVKHGNVVVLNNNYISEPGPRIIQPTTKLAEKLHGITVSNTVSGPVVVGSNHAKTYKGSSKYLDVNGDGKLTISDVQALFAHLNQVNGNSKFDYNGDGKVNIGDVQKLFHDVTS